MDFFHKCEVDSEQLKTLMCSVFLPCDQHWLNPRLYDGVLLLWEA